MKNLIAIASYMFDENIDEAWQFWESTFMAIMGQHIPKGVLPRKESFLG